MQTFQTNLSFPKKTWHRLKLSFTKITEKIPIHTSFLSFKLTSNLISFYSNVNRTVENRQWKDWKEIERKWKTKIRFFFEEFWQYRFFCWLDGKLFQTKRLFWELIYFGLKSNWDSNWGEEKPKRWESISKDYRKVFNPALLRYNLHFKYSYTR